MFEILKLLLGICLVGIGGAVASISLVFILKKMGVAVEVSDKARRRPSRGKLFLVIAFGVMIAIPFFFKYGLSDDAKKQFSVWMKGK